MRRRAAVLFRRTVRLATVLAVAALVASPAGAEGQDKVIRIGFQKYGNLILLKGKGWLEKKLQPLGYGVEWKEFPSGPPLLEALNVGSIDFGHAGETPPIFAQAAGAPFVYVAHEPPAPEGEAILVPKDSPIKTVAELKGKKVALNKGSNVHYLLVRALEKAGLKYTDIETVFLAPADARAAFERGSVDAWVIWDPFQAAAEVATNARTLTNGSNLAPNHQFYLATRKFSDGNPQVIDAVIASIAELDDWAKTRVTDVAAELSPGIGIPAPILEIALKRQSYGVKPLDESVVAEQQRIADTFFYLGLIPKSIAVATVVRKPAS
ncbi:MULTISPECIES: sulfonate ABC transporter substrate-binding protein [unclassified Bradyrhizobium]|uniref:sulfonate ABC transporter substrate-binding protein n=1 Tax=unclassified Bradyrhizobium TaxID=2631580 RepID=UPI0028E25948|nr:MULTISPECIES: sulfonate ABC transporter substrate-binding protein [unclassified Bradyrhizobium]